MSSVARAAGKALSLKKDRIFKLLMVMSVLLSVLVGFGASSLAGLETLYSSWHLTHKNRLSVYVTADAGEDVLQTLSIQLREIKGVKKVRRLYQSEVRDLLGDYVEGESYFPVPHVFDVDVAENINRKSFDAQVHDIVPNAEINDARQMLSAVSAGVRTIQMVIIAVAAVLLFIMAMLVSLTVNAGLRGMRKSLMVMQYVGATDRFVTQLVTKQVLIRVMISWFIAIVFVSAVLFVVKYTWETIGIYMGASVWVSAIVTPLLFSLVAVLAAWLTTTRIIKR